MLIKDPENFLAEKEIENDAKNSGVSIHTMFPSMMHLPTAQCVSNSAPALFGFLHSILKP